MWFTSPPFNHIIVWYWLHACSICDWKRERLSLYCSRNQNKCEIFNWLMQRRSTLWKRIFGIRVCMCVCLCWCVVIYCWCVCVCVEEAYVLELFCLSRHWSNISIGLGKYYEIKICIPQPNIFKTNIYLIEGINCNWYLFRIQQQIVHLFRNHSQFHGTNWSNFFSFDKSHENMKKKSIFSSCI